MADDTSLDSVEKKELESTEEETVPGKFYVPPTDIHETSTALVLTMEMPGVAKDKVDVRLEKNVLSVEGRIDFSKYDDLEPVYTEYNVGHFRRSFKISNEIDQAKIAARLADGVLTLDLPKVEEQQPRTIAIG
jgi:HSP20 family molecular chaperone IbpA